MTNIRLRNWVECALGKRYEWPPRYYMNRRHRKVYAIEFEDGTTANYYIDFDRQTIEPVNWED